MNKLIKHGSSILLLMVLLCTLLIPGFAYPAPSYGAQDTMAKTERMDPLSFAHRSAWRMAPENSLPAVYHAITMGVDGVEVDVMLSKDGILTLMHDSTIDRNVVGHTGKVADYTWSQLRSMALRPEQGGTGSTKYTMSAAQAKVLNTLPNYSAHYGKAASSGATVNVARFDDCMDMIAIYGPKTVVTIDKCSNETVFSACYKLLREKNMLGNAYFKCAKLASDMTAWFPVAVKDWNTAHPEEPITVDDVKNSILFLQVMGNPNQSILQDHLNNGNYLKAVEITYGEDTAAAREKLITNGFADFCHANGIALYGATIFSGGWSGGRPDSEKTWAYMLNMGFDGIQTDRPAELVSYLYDYNRHRGSDEVIQVEHFHNMSSVNANFSLPLEANASMNKTLNNLRNGEWLEYRNITFTGNEKSLKFAVRGLNAGAKLNFYIDSIATTNLIGSYTLTSESAGSSRKVDLTRSITPGAHKVYLQVSGTAGTNLASLDYFTFLAEAEYLYFDFDSNADSATHFHNLAYNDTNYDLPSNWFAPSGRTTAPAIADGAITISLATDTTYTYHYIETGTKWEAHPLNYIPHPGEVCQVRFKIDNAVSPAVNGESSFVLFYGVDGGSINENYVRMVFRMSDVADKGYVTYTIPMDEKWSGRITALRPFVNGIQSIPGKQASISFDYIYVGPESLLNEQDYMYFGFENTAADHQRYLGRVYGGRNFDLASNWYHISSRTTAPYINEGAIHFGVLPTDSTAYQYIQTGTSSVISEFPLHYTPGSEDYCQVRLKIDNAVSTNPNANGFVLYHDYQGEAPGGNYKLSKTFNLENVLNRGYFTLTFPLDSSYYKEAGQITCIRPFVNAIQSAPGKHACISIDYLYIGPKGKLPNPMHTVTFLNEDGALLDTTQVIRGDTAVYNGVTPTKAPDALKHYTFKGWDTALTNIQSDITVIARFTATAHTFSNGSCLCGVTQSNDPVENASLKLNHSLNLASDISVNLVIPKTQLQGFDMDTVYVDSTLDTYEGNRKVGTTAIRLLPVDKGSYYYFTLDGLTAVQMQDTITSILYGIKAGRPYCSPIDVYSIATYAYSQLDKTTVADNLKTLCADLLRYGAKAQIFKNYRTDSLADANMTDAHRAYLSDMSELSFGNTNVTLNDMATPSVTWVGKVLDLQSKVALKFVFDIAGYTGSLDDLSLRVSYTDIEGKAVTATVKGLESYNAEAGLYAISFDGLLAAELRSVLSLRIYEGDTPVSCTLQYSADTYGNNKTGNLLELCKALFAYSDSAKNFFQ